MKMGQSMSWLSGLLWSKKEIRILILGLVRDVIVSGGQNSSVDGFDCRITPERRQFCIDSRSVHIVHIVHLSLGLRLLRACANADIRADWRGGDNDSNYRVQR